LVFPITAIPAGLLPLEVLRLITFLTDWIKAKILTERGFLTPLGSGQITHSILKLHLSVFLCTEFLTMKTLPISTLENMIL